MVKIPRDARDFFDLIKTKDHNSGKFFEDP